VVFIVVYSVGLERGKKMEPRVLLKLKRKSFGLSQDELATAAGFKRSLIADIESGRRALTRELAKALHDGMLAARLEHERKLTEIEHVLGGDEFPTPEKQQKAIDDIGEMEDSLKDERDQDVLANAKLSRRVRKLEAEVKKLKARLNRKHGR
jgi:transcriptional regulator with XRE-family HTH domain